MDIKQLIAEMKNKGASDVHLEPGLPPTVRIQGALIPQGKAALDPRLTLAMAGEIMSESDRKAFQRDQVVDFSKVLHNVQCRVNIMRTQRGVGLAIRLLSAFQPTIERLNLHSDIADLVKNQHGLLLVCGPTGSGKSSTLAALIHEINHNERRHIVTIESPIEYPLIPKLSFIRQREVGRDTPSFERALIDSLRQDPDVIMVGEMRDLETMRLTLNAAETGQLVMSTLHSSSGPEAMQRMVSAFPSEIQGSVRGQLADCLIAVVSQRLRFREDFGIRVPVCEVMMASHSIRNLIRQGHFYKIASAMETGLNDGNWTIRRYEEWLDRRDDFFIPESGGPVETIPVQETPFLEESIPIAEVLEPERGIPPVPGDALDVEPPIVQEVSTDENDVFVIEEPDEKDLGELLKKLDKKKKGPQK